MSIISTEKLGKSYGSSQVLHNISLQVKAGKLVGFLGPNGAGKTTTIRILLGLLRAYKGEARIFGKSCRDSGKSIRRDVGYLPGDVHLYPGITGMATLKHYSRIRKTNCDLEIKRLSDRLELPLSRRVRKYSTGMRQKLGLIQALMHKPDLLILDEPTSALDPLIRTSVLDELRSVVTNGRTVLFSSHSLNEVEELCDEVIILRDGQIVEQQEIEVLRSRALRKVTITFDSESSIPKNLPGSLHQIGSSGPTIVCTWAGEISKLLDWFQLLKLSDLTVERPDLNDLFITYYSENGDAESNSRELPNV